MIQKPLEIYLHIPFCVKKCNYCDFLSFGTEDDRLKGSLCHPSRQIPVPEAYVDRLCEEIQWYGRMEKYRRRPVTSLFLGGGTPSLLSEEQIQKIMFKLRDCFDLKRGAEITIEANPGTLTPGKLRCMRIAGINRLSIGLQSASAEELKILGRIHSWEAFLQSFKWARDAGFVNINVDIITAVPGQTTDSCRKTLEQVLKLGPEHISAYSLIIEQGTPFEAMEKKGEINLPGEDEEREMYRMTGDLLSKKGYNRYEISNYAKPGFECRHNLGYWQRRDYLGLGLGAASLFDGSRFTNPVDLNMYMTGEFGNGEWYSSFEVLEMKAAMEEFMFLGLRLMKGVSEAEFNRQFQQKIMAVYGRVIKEKLEERLLARKNGRIYLTERGIDLANVVMAEFLLE